MRAGSSTIQQTLTPEAAAVLNHSIAESSRRNHGQTTPLHVAAALLSSPSGYLRQACIRSHPNSSHPLQCRALELCFSVALERLPSAVPAPGMEPEPPISNALMAALKRAQANQRRGCPDQNQQPLLAVKVELDQLIVSILDDPGVSRVMREAGFSSPAVKAAIEQSLTSPSPNANHHHHRHIAPILYCLNPGGPDANMRAEEINRLLEIMLRTRKRNPILVGDFSEPESIVRELVTKIQSNQELGNDGFLKNVRVISMDKNSFFLPSKIKELGDTIESAMGIGGVIIDLGDLRWLVEHQHQQQGITERGRAVVAEMAQLLARFKIGDPDDNKVWLIGTANCETYLRCQVYYSTMESEWDLQAVPMSSRPLFPGKFPRVGTERFLSNALEPLNPARALQTLPPSLAWHVLPENVGSCQRTTALFCPRCLENYKKELSELEAIAKSISESKEESTQPPLPQWLQNAKVNANDTPQEKIQGVISDQKTEELKKKWRDTCLHLHQGFHQSSCADRLSLPATLSMTSLYNSNLLTRPFIQPLQLNSNIKVNVQLTDSPPLECPVQTDLVLGRKGADDKFVDDYHQAKDFLGCISSNKLANRLDADTYKNLHKRLMEKAWWQAEATSSVASAVTRCRLGNGKRCGSRGDVWLLFAGPDRAGKEKMVSALAEHLYGARPITIRLSDGGESVRGKTTVDRLAEVVRRNPSSVIMIDGLDEAGEIVQGSIKRAIEGCRIRGSYGHEVSIGNVVFVLMGDWSSSNRGGVSRDGEIPSVGSGGWKLGLLVGEKNTKKRHASWSGDEDDRPMRSRTDAGSGVSFDLNLGLTLDDGCDRTDGSRNSSDLTIDHEDFLITLVPHDLLDSVDESIVFKPFDSGFVMQEIKRTISMRFSAIVGGSSSLEVGDEVLEKILGGLLHDQSSLKEWVERVLGPSFDRVKSMIPSDERSGYVVRLVVESGSELSQAGKSKGRGDWLPNSVIV